MPDRLVVRPLTDSLVVQWVPNRRSKYIVRGYYLGYGKGIPDVYRQVFDADTFFYTIENLRKFDLFELLYITVMLECFPVRDRSVVRIDVKISC